MHGKYPEKTVESECAKIIEKTEFYNVYLSSPLKKMVCILKIQSEFLTVIIRSVKFTYSLP